MMSEHIAEQVRIEQGLQATRVRMGGHLDQLRERLTPGRVLDDLMVYFRGNEGREFGRNLVDSVRANPLPAALTGIGLTWLMASNPKPGDGDHGPRTSNGRVHVFPVQAGPVWPSHDALDRHISAIEKDVIRRNDESEFAYGVRLDAARAEALGIARDSDDTHESFGKKVRDGLSSARESVTQSARDLADKATAATGQVSGTARSAGTQLAHGSQSAQQMGSNLLSSITDSPVLLGAVGLAIGALLGAVVPQSDQEEHALEGMAGQARGAGRDLAQNVVDSGGRVAQQALGAGQHSARTHVLTGDKSAEDLVKDAQSGDLAGSVKQVAKDVLKAGDEAFRKEGMGVKDHDPAKAPSSSL